jgi:hypothetical protein
MIPLKKLFEIADFALANKFEVEFRSYEDNGNIDMKLSYGDQVISYRAIDNAVFVEDIHFNGNFEYFEAELNLLNVFLKIGKMIEDAAKDGGLN